MIRIYHGETYEAMSLRAAHIIAAEIHHNPACVLGLATGSSPVGTYKNLVSWVKSGELSFKDVQTVNLDEYKGLAPDHDQSYRYFMDTNLFNHVDIDPANTRVPNGLAEDLDAECAAYDAMIESLGFADLQLLGIGNNGHIGFNEPDDHFTKETHVVDLAPGTIEANARFFASVDDVPRQALSMGIGCIMAAKRVLLIASGKSKAQALYDSFCGPITPKCPGSILQLHKDVVVVADNDALSKLLEAGATVAENGLVTI